MTFLESIRRLLLEPPPRQLQPERSSLAWASRSGERWGPDEVALILWPPAGWSDEDLAAYLGRTPNAVKCRRWAEHEARGWSS